MSATYTLQSLQTLPAITLSNSTTLGTGVLLSFPTGTSGIIFGEQGLCTPSCAFCNAEIDVCPKLDLDPLRQRMRRTLLHACLRDIQEAPGHANFEYVGGETLYAKFTDCMFTARMTPKTSRCCYFQFVKKKVNLF